MKDLLEFLTKHLRVYLPAFTAVVSGPKSAVAQHVSGAKEDLENALLFGGITLAIGFGIQAPLVPKGQDFMVIAGSILIAKTIFLFLFVCVVWGLFRLLGGRGSFEATLAAYLYIVSPVFLAVILLNLISFGFLSAHDPVLAKSGFTAHGIILGNANFEKFVTDSPGAATGYILSILLAYVAVFTWFLICWGAFREIHDVPRWKSAIAFVVSYAALYPFTAIYAKVMFGLFGPDGPVLW